MPIQKGSFTPGPSYDSFSGKGDGYENPITQDGKGDRTIRTGKKHTIADGKGGAQKGPYDAAPNRTVSPQESQSSRLGGGGKKSGYDNASIEKDFGFQGHRKGRKDTSVGNA